MVERGWDQIRQQCDQCAHLPKVLAFGHGVSRFYFIYESCAKLS